MLEVKNEVFGVLLKRLREDELEKDAQVRAAKQLKQEIYRLAEAKEVLVQQTKVYQADWEAERRKELALEGELSLLAAEMNALDKLSTNDVTEAGSEDAAGTDLIATLFMELEKAHGQMKMLRGHKNAIEASRAAKMRENETAKNLATLGDLAEKYAKMRMAIQVLRNRINTETQRLDLEKAYAELLNERPAGMSQVHATKLELINALLEVYEDVRS